MAPHVGRESDDVRIPAMLLRDDVGVVDVGELANDDGAPISDPRVREGVRAEDVAREARDVGGGRPSVGRRAPSDVDEVYEQQQKRFGPDDLSPVE